MLTVRQTAELLNVKPGTLHAWRYLASIGKQPERLPYTRIGSRTIRYRLSDVEALIAAGREE
jgi:hypothetical protein